MEAVRRYCRSRVGSEQDAEDAAQAAFLRYLEHAGEDVQNPEAWLINAASFECRDLLRRRQREQRNSERASTAEPTRGFDPEGVATARLLASSVLTRLPDRDRELLALRYMCDLSVDQLAAALRVSAGNARVMALRARRRASTVLEAMETGVAAIVGVPALGLRTLHDRMRTLRARLVASGRTLFQPCGWESLAGAVPVLTPALATLLVATTSGGAIAHQGMTAATASSSMPRVAGADGSDPLALRAASQETDGNMPGSSSPAAPAPPSGAAPAGAGYLVQAITAPSANADQTDAAFTSITPSPGYRQDHTVYASGTLVDHCLSSCAVVFASHDAAASWQPVATPGYLGGKIMLAPSYPEDAAMFAVAPAVGLQRTSAAGQPFLTAVPGVGTASMAPQLAADGPRMIVATSVLSVYHVRSGLLTPGPALPATVTSIGDLIALGSGDQVLASVVEATATGGRQNAVLLCDTVACATVHQADGPTALQLAAAAPDGMGGYQRIFAFGPERMWLSTDDGHAFSAAAVPSGLQLASMSAINGATPHVLGSGVLTVDGHLVSRLLTSHDGGASFQDLASSGLPASALVSEVVLLPDGRALAAMGSLDPQAGMGLRCSTDGGAIWTLSC